MCSHACSRTRSCTRGRSTRTARCSCDRHPTSAQEQTGDAAGAEATLTAALDWWRGSMTAEPSAASAAQHWILRRLVRSTMPAEHAYADRTARPGRMFSSVWGSIVTEPRPTLPWRTMAA